MARITYLDYHFKGVQLRQLVLLILARAIYKTAYRPLADHNRDPVSSA